MTKITCLPVLLLGFALGLSARGADKEFVPLVRGDDPQQFQLVGIGPDTLSISNGEIRVSGKPNGYFATKESYKNYILRFEWMYERPSDLTDDAKFNGNSGLLVHIAGAPKVWPKCIEVQLMNRDAGAIIPIVGGKIERTKDAAAQRRAIKPVGQWNQEEVTCRDGTIVCRINGIEIARGQGADPDHGPIGWQSEGRPIHFRGLQIQPLD
jgi:hypothetical protein